MKYRYYIVSLFGGDVKGTDDPETVERLRHSEDHFVIDIENGAWLTANGPQDIPQYVEFKAD